MENKRKQYRRRLSLFNKTMYWTVMIIACVLPFFIGFIIPRLMRRIICLKNESVYAVKELGEISLVIFAICSFASVILITISIILYEAKISLYRNKSIHHSNEVDYEQDFLFRKQNSKKGKLLKNISISLFVISSLLYCSGLCMCPLSINSRCVLTEKNIIEYDATGTERSKFSTEDVKSIQIKEVTVGGRTQSSRLVFSIVLDDILGERTYDFYFSDFRDTDTIEKVYKVFNDIIKE